MPQIRPPERIRRIRPGPHGVASFTQHDGGTRMTFELDLGARGVLRLLAPLLAWGLSRQTRAHPQRFKALAERSIS
jgi:hypothetical protein